MKSPAKCWRTSIGVSESSLHGTCRLQFGSHHFLSFEGRCCFWINTASSATWLCPPRQEELSTLKGGQERIHNRHSLKANVPLWSDLYAWNFYYIILFSKGTRFDVLTPRTWTWNERSCWCTVTAVVGHKSRQRIFFYYCQYSVLCLLDWVRPSLRWCWTTNCLRRWDSSAGLESRPETRALGALNSGSHRASESA